MMMLPPSVKLYVATQPVDARRSFNGLSLYVESVLQKSPLCGHLFVFFNRRADHVQILYWDRNGYALWRKRLERGRFALPSTWKVADGAVTVEAIELALILDGISLAGARKRPRWEPMHPKSG